jgi:hypothetical protein
MAARLIFHRKRTSEDGAISEIKVWEVEEAVVGSQHRLKYSLYYGKAGVRLVGYDNERGKGDHRHYGDQEETYVFTDVSTLVADFLKDVARAKGSSGEQ